MAVILMEECLGISLAQKNNAVLKFDRFQDLVLTTESFRLPGISTSNPQVSAPRGVFDNSPTAIYYEPLIVNFMVTGGAHNYRTIAEWIQTSLKKPQNEVFSDASVVILDPSKKPVVALTLLGVIPKALSGIDFSYQESSNDIYLHANVTFSILRYEFRDAI